MRAVVVLAVMVGALIVATPARAGTYDVWGCRLPDGAPAPTDGWKPIPTVSSPPLVDSCGSNGSLQLHLAAEAVGYWEDSSWRFRAPAGTTLDNVTLQRAAAISGDREFHLYREFTDNAWPPARTNIEKCITWFDPCTSVGDLLNPASPSNTLERDALGGAIGLSATLECHPRAGQYCPAVGSPWNGTVAIWRSRIGLEDLLPPSFTAPLGGPLLSAEPVSGAQFLTFAAADRGGGVQSIGLAIDGLEHGWRAVDPADNSCRPPYVRVVPCPLAVQPTFAVDTTQISNGSHTLRLLIQDVAGNQTQSDPFTVVVANSRRPNGVPASRSARIQAWFKSSRAHRTVAIVGYGRRRTVVGSLRAPGGKGIAGALVDVTARPTRAGARARLLGTVATNEAGRFQFLVPRGPSRQVHIAYRAFMEDRSEAASANLALNVRAGIRFSVSPARVRNGSVATFAGKLLGGPSRFGTQVSIYAIGGRRRIPVETVSADRRGRFHYRYRFRSIAGRVVFRFQAVAKPQPNYPYARGASASVVVRGRP